LLFYTGSLKKALLAMLPNFLPILLIFGGMSLFSVGLNVANTMVASITLGLAIDDTMHLLSDWKKSGYESMDHFFEHSFSPMTLTSLILFFGFSLFLFSGFESIFTFGWMMMLSSLFALLSDVLFFNSVLYIFNQK
ncbi:hypothetical protein MJH12_16160, partial [bacterium]|nr:hypothetical protein [bacterium]